MMEYLRQAEVFCLSYLSKVRLLASTLQWGQTCRDSMNVDRQRYERDDMNELHNMRFQNWRAWEIWGFTEEENFILDEKQNQTCWQNEQRIAKLVLSLQ